MSLLPMDNGPLAAILGQSGPSWLPQQARANPFGLGQGGGLRGLLGDPNFALQLLANSGPSPQKRSFGQILGTSALQAQQMGQQQQDSELDRAYRQAQIEALGRGSPRKPVVIAGPDGKPIYVDENEAIGKSPFLASQDGVGDYQPGDYTAASWAKFVAGDKKDPAVLERYITPRQEFSPSFQNVTRTNPDGSTQQGTFNTRTGEYNWTNPVVPAGTKPRVDAQGAAEGKIAGELAAKSGKAYNTFKTGMSSLEQAMSATDTGPLAGRLPAITAAQQVAEGAEATMAPVLKQLFRESGEGTFTDSDQALLMKMVPTRKEHPEARRAKIEMIDGIVRAKLGIDTGSQGQATANDGWVTLPNGVRVREKK